MRERSACPDVAPPRSPTNHLPLAGTLEMFPECPAAWLRTADMLSDLEDRFGKRPFAPHLIDDAIHPATIISALASEVESGARNSDGISPKAWHLVQLWFREKQAARDYESEQRRKKTAA